VVTTVFGSGRPTTTDTVGLDGEINSPIDAIFEPTENYLYMTDRTGGGLVRKLAVTNQYSGIFTAKYFVKTVFVTLNCNFCEYLATGKSNQLYISSMAHNIKKLPVVSENSNDASYSSAKISGSMGDTSCTGAACAGDVEGVETFARYDTISGLALQVTSDVAATDVALFIADKNNNKIRRLELTSGNNVMTTFDAGPVDLIGQYLAGIVINTAMNRLYVGGLGVIYSYDISIGAASKSVLAGQQNVVDVMSGIYIYIFHFIHILCVD
jgi:hypothetical protein